MEILSPRDLEQIKKHKYRSENFSILERLIDPYWRKLVEKLPRWLSPNILTLVGLLSIIVPCSILLYFSYHKNLPYVSYMSYFCSLGYMMWLNMDSLDGKLARQNRPTQASSLGELLDHGGDAVAWLLAAITIVCQVGLNTNHVITLMFVFSILICNFIAEPWTIYLTGVLKFQSVDFVEVIVIMSTISLLTGLYGLEFWSYQIISYFNICLGHIPVGLNILIAPDIIIGKLPLISVAKKQKGLKLSEILQPGVSQGINLLCCVAAYFLSSAGFLDRNIIPFVLFFGLIIVKIHIRFIVIHMTNNKYKAYDRCLLLSVCFALGLYLVKSSENQERLLFVFLFLAILDVSVYYFCLCYQLYHVFDDRIFVLNKYTKVEDPDQNQNGKRSKNKLED